jgi:hypothetical protein
MFLRLSRLARERTYYKSVRHKVIARQCELKSVRPNQWE